MEDNTRFTRFEELSEKDQNDMTEALRIALIKQRASNNGIRTSSYIYAEVQDLVKKARKLCVLGILHIGQEKEQEYKDQINEIMATICAIHYLNGIPVSQSDANRLILLDEYDFILGE